MTILWHRQRGDTAMIKPCYAFEGGPSDPTGWMASTQVGRKPSSMSSMLIGRRRYLGRNARQLAALAADNATDERGKARQMLGQTAAGLARIPLFQGLTYGTIAPKVVTHRIPPLI